MKKLIMILIAVATFQVSAQDQKRDMKKQRTSSKMNYSPEEMAQLKSKKLTLKLDLDTNQQNEVADLYLKQAQLRQSKKEAYLQGNTKGDRKDFSKAERLKMANARLDQKIEMKRKMKDILSEEQYKKWGKMNQKRHHKSKRHGMRSKNRKEGMPQQKTKQ
ncbi:hypothetical protein [Gelidibacter maritimus]|uniref:DUF4890 domain-containing protein n=1 Tax=Gelidibacter maritimus TaxID=2761487 RepID=A0A7W2R4U7_9FLAO|nr:hypothetical protein [Gelidibacter maritimus]MBA6154063.1 hypothetical protein [Gelidibacter maritimus]